MDDNKLATMKPLPLVLSMALPLMLSMALQTLYSIADSIFISRFSEETFAAVSIVQPLLLLATAAANGIAAGEGSLLSKLLGEGSGDRARSSIGTAWTLSVSISLALLLAVFLIASPFIGFFLPEDSGGRTDALSYLLIMSLAFPFQFAASLSSFILQAHGMSKSAMIIHSSGAIANIILDPVFIFTLGLGAAGAAAASAIGYLLSAIIGIVLYFSMDIVRSGFSFRKEDGRRIFQIALPSLMVQAASPIVAFFLNKLVISYGTDVMAVYGIYLKTESFMFLASSGIANALLVITGYNYGRRDRERILECYRTALILSWSIMLIGFALFQVFASQIISIFTSDPGVKEIGKEAFRLLCFCFLLTSPNIITGGLFQGLGLGKRSLAITYCRFFLFLIPLAFILNRLFGLPGIWLSFFASDIPTLFLIIHLFRKTRRELLV